MAWSEEQKAIGRAELKRRLTYETAATYRKGLFKAAGVGIGCLLLAILGANSFRPGSTLVIRAEGIITFLVGVAGLALAVALSYVRYLDWGRRSRSEN